MSRQNLSGPLAGSNDRLLTRRCARSATISLLLFLHGPTTAAQDIQELVLDQSASAFHLPLEQNTLMTFTSSVEADEAVKRIVDKIGLPKNFVIRAADVSNAAAVIRGNQRYILYSNIFMNRVKDVTHTDWAATSILAHEVGHHLAGHTITNTGSIPIQELEADRFSGFVLARMGAALTEATAAMANFGSDDPSPTHPARSTRLEAIAAGWTQARETPSAPTVPPPDAQLSSTCKFNQGPRAGQVQSYRGQVQPIPVGSPCQDGQESSGVAIPDSGTSGGTGGPQGQLSSTCRFNQGPRAGQVQSYQGQVQPIPAGSYCQDGQGSSGVAIPDSGTSGGPGAVQLSSTCRFNRGPRSGDVQSYEGQVQPIPVGSPCQDGQGSSGVAIPDSGTSDGTGAAQGYGGEE